MQSDPQHVLYNLIFYNREYEDDRSSVYSKAEDYNDWCSSKRIETVMPKSASKTETRQRKS